MKWLLAAIVLIGCGKHHDSSERDTKGRSTAVIGEGKIATAAATTTTVVAAPSRDPASVELGTVTLSWPGKITQSNGKAPPIGSSCALNVLASSASPTKYGKDVVTVTCGAQTLYDWNAKASGQVNWDFRMTEWPLPGAVSSFEYRLAASDVGARTGDRSQFSVSTKDKELVVFSEIAPTFRVKIALDSVRAVRSGKPLFEAAIPPFPSVIKSKAALASSKGALPFTGKSCELRISPGMSTHNCIVRLECNAKIVFGLNDTGWEDCTLDASGAPVAVSDTKPTPQDHDPELTVDMNAKTAVLADELANGTSYSASFTLQ